MIWYVNFALSVLIAIANAGVGNEVCFLWAGLAWLDWQIAGQLTALEEKKGEQDEL